jgi:hypothetical protein
MISNWNNASANAWVDYSGRWWFVGAGVAWHAGAVLPGMPGNFEAIGIETDYTVGETISWDMYDSLRRGTAAIMRAMKQPDGDLHFHKSICSPPGRKSDPWALNLTTERNAVGTIKRGGNTSLPLPDPKTPGGPGGTDPLTPEQLDEKDIEMGTQQILDALTSQGAVIQALRGQVDAMQSRLAGLETKPKLSLVLNVDDGRIYAYGPGQFDHISSMEELQFGRNIGVYSWSPWLETNTPGIAVFRAIATEGSGAAAPKA